MTKINNSILGATGSFSGNLKINGELHIDEDIWMPMGENWKGGEHKFKIGDSVVLNLSRQDKREFIGIITSKFDYKEGTEPRYLIDIGGEGDTVPDSIVRRETEIEKGIRRYKEFLSDESNRKTCIV